MYNPYQMNPFGYMPQQPSIPNVLQQQQITQVSGKASVDTIQLAPNSSLLAMDTTAPIVWMCVSDGVGKVTSKPFSITPYVEKPPVDVNSLEKRLADVESALEEMEKRNAKSNANVSKPQRNDENRNKQYDPK